MPSQREAGNLTDIIGPLHVAGGMQASVPIGHLPSDTPENLFNVDLDRNGRGVARPGSVFYSRVGEGRVLGLHEHTFESGTAERRIVAMVADAYGEVNTIADPAEDGVVTHDVGLVTDASDHETPIIGVSAKKTDGFHMESFLNRLWIAGSTLTHRLHFYDYTTLELVHVEGIRCTAVTASGNRLFVGGDPNAPNVLYPSDPDDGATFNPNIGIQVGTRNDTILSLIEHEQLIVVLTDRGAHWVVTAAVELGEVEVEKISGVLGVTGPLAADEAQDGWVYWLSKQGPVRWRRGTPSPDMDFNAAALELFENAASGDLRSAVVQDDPTRDCVRFIIPSGLSTEPSYVLTYFYRHGAWTHGAKTVDPTQSTLLRERTARVREPLGDGLYSSSAYIEDPLTGHPEVLLGGTEGVIWRMREFSREKIRHISAGNRGTDLRCQIRFGPLEIAPSGYRGQIHDLLLDFLGGPEFDFVVRAEMDFAGIFRTAGRCVRGIPGGDMGEIILGDTDDARIFDLRFHPYHMRIPMWVQGLGKVVRVEVEWNAVEAAQAFTGFEIERSMAADAKEKARGDATTTFQDSIEFEGTVDPGSGDSVAGESGTPHAEPTDPEGDAISLAILAESADDELHFADVSDPNALVDLGFDSLPLNDSPQRLALHNDQYAFSYSPGSSGRFQILDVTSPPTVTELVDYSVAGDSPHDGSHFPGGMFYDAGHDWLILTVVGSGGSSSTRGSYVFVYDVSDKTAPVALSVHRYADYLDGGQRATALRIMSDGRTGFVLDREDFGGGLRDAMYSFRIAADGTSVNVLDTIPISPENSAGVNTAQSHITLNDDQTRLATAYRNAATNNYWLRTYNIEDPGNLVVLETLQLPSGEGGVDGAAWGWRDQGNRIYVHRREGGAGANDGVQVYDADDLSFIGVFDAGIDANQSSTDSLARHWNGDLMFWSIQALIASLDLTDEVSFTVLDTEIVGSDGKAIAHRYDPNVQSVEISAAGPDPLPADLIACYSRDGIVAYIDLEDETAPALTGFVSGLWTDGSPYFFNAGQHLVVVGNSRLAIYGEETAGALSKIAELEDDQLDGFDFVDVNADGDTAYGVNASNEVVVVDLSDPSDPTISSSTAMDIPFLAAPYLRSRGDLEIPKHLVGHGYGVWLADKATGKWLGATAEPALAEAEDVVIDGTTGWVMSTYTGCIISAVDISSPYRQAVQGSLHLSLLDPQGIVVDGTELYVLNKTETGTAIASIDISTPSAPALLDELEADPQLKNATAFAVSGTELWVVCSDGSSRVARVDISTPGALSIVASEPLAENGTAAAGGTHLIAGEAGGTKVRAYSMGSPPALVDEIELGADLGEIVGVGVFSSGGEKAAVLTSGVTGGQIPRVTVVDTSDPVTAGLSTVGSTSNDPANADGLEGDVLEAFTLDAANLVAVAGGEAGPNQPKPVNIVDLSAPATPSVDFKGSPDWAREPSAFALDSNLLMIGRSNPVHGTALVDVSTLSSPSLHKMIEDRWAGWDKTPLISTTREKIFVLGSQPTEKLLELDIDDSASPRQQAGTLTGDTGARAFAVDFNATVALIAREDGPNTDLEVWDIADPNAATLEGSVSVPHEIVDVRPSGTDPKFIVTAGEGQGYVAVVDASTASAPTILGKLEKFAVSSHPWKHVRLW